MDGRIIVVGADLGATGAERGGLEPAGDLAADQDAQQRTDDQPGAERQPRCATGRASMPPSPARPPSRKPATTPTATVPHDSQPSARSKVGPA